MPTDLVMRSHRFPAELYEAAKAVAYEQRVSISEVLVSALERFVRESGK